VDVLPGVLVCRYLRRTVQGTPRNQHPAVARWHAHLRGLATAIHEISGLGSLKINHLNHIQFHLRSRKLSMEKNNKGYNRKRKDWQMNAVKNVICAATGQNIGVVKYGDLGWVSLCF
ncbi:MAG: hypothetical protein OEU80_16325, partial [Deltaproteobacteria bacterium]|nr:hypothetical protein [Deltaproteobacteria bacterium]